MAVVNVIGAEKICPLQSGRPITVSGFSAGTNAQGVTLTMVPCAREKCQWWENDDCAFSNVAFCLDSIVLRLSDLVVIGQKLEPPSLASGGSPLMRLATSIEKLVAIVTERLPIKK